MDIWLATWVKLKSPMVLSVLYIMIKMDILGFVYIFLEIIPFIKTEKEFYNPIAPGDVVEIEPDQLNDEKGQIILKDWMTEGNIRIVEIEAPEDTVGPVIEALGVRGGTMENMSNLPGVVKLHYVVPSRGLIGFTTDFMTMTKGYGILNHTFREYLPKNAADVGERKLGVLVSMENGKSTAYALGGLEDRGIMFIEPGADVYEGMIVGESNKEGDLAVNVVKGKQLTNTRSAGKDHTVVLKKTKLLTLETALEYINNDELVEVTPLNFRLRKKILNTEERKKYDARIRNEQK